MPYQILLGLNVLDSEKFEDYCSAMERLVARHDGELCYDFKVPDFCLADRHKTINRVFTLSFCSKEKMEAFFSDREYLKTRGRHVLKSIGSDQVIFGFEK